MRLSELSNNNTGVITKVLGHGSFRKRITEMGFVKSKVVTVIKNAPLQDPIEYQIMGYNVSLRRSEAALIEIISEEEALKMELSQYEGTVVEERLKVSAKEKSHTINVALVGNPNCGKTSLFNHASGLHEKVGNYGGVTIDSKEAMVNIDGYRINIFDLPGTYSITEYTPEELFVRSHIFDTMPDVVINVVDASNLERNLYLTTQLIDMNIKVIMALNMYDELESKGGILKYKELGTLLGIPIVPTIAIKGKGIDDLLRKAIEVYEDSDPVLRHIHVNYGSSIEKSINTIKQLVKENKTVIDRYYPRYLSIKLLEGDKATHKLLSDCSNYSEIRKVTDTEVEKLEREFGEKTETTITDAKYGFISGALAETLTVTQPINKWERSRLIDEFLTHKFWGFPLFFFFMWVMFQTTFSLGSYPMDWIDAGVGLVGDLVRQLLPEGALQDLIVDGIIGGVGGVIIFLPNILILFFFISFMEDTGYMARVSFIMDRVMHKIGLHGKSFIPLLMGFGCNVPAVMATRTLESKKDRLMTMLIAPFMSCSARLPVYVLIISAFFPSNQGLVLFSIYLIGILMAVIVALVLNKTVFSKQDIPFVMELPPYRIPTMRNTTVHMWFKASQYLKKMGTMILLASILIWALSYYPRHVDYSKDFAAEISSINTNSLLSDSVKQLQVADVELQMLSEHQEQSYIGKIGQFIEPAIEPLGFDWRIGISIVTGLAAKEIVVSSMGILYHAEREADETSGSLMAKLQNQVYTTGDKIGQKVFTPLVAFSFMLFILIYFPCVAVIAAIKKESSWKWATFTMFYTTAMAWVVSFLVFQIGSLFI